MRDTLDDAGLVLKYDSEFTEVRASVFKIAGLKETSPLILGEEMPTFVTEDGEEVEDVDGVDAFDFTLPSRTTSRNVTTMLRSMLIRRPAMLEQIFNELRAIAKTEHDEELKRKKRREERFISLLEEYYYRSDHVGTSYDDAKPVLERHSA